MYLSRYMLSVFSQNYLFKLNFQNMLLQPIARQTFLITFCYKIMVINAPEIFSRQLPISKTGHEM
jgi:hypothetical protein